MEQEKARDSSSQINSKLLTTAINNHGHELMRALQTEQGEIFLGAVDARSINYVQYHQQAQQQEFQLRYKKQRLLQFIARKAVMLFKQFNGELPIVPDKVAENQFAVLPPLEEYMEVPAVERRRLFYQTLDKGDYVIGQVKSLSASGYFVTLLCLDGGKKMFIHDLGIKTVLLATNIPIKIGDLIRATVHGYTRNTQKIMLKLTNDVKNIPEMNLGVISHEELPSHYRDSPEGLMKFIDVLVHRESFWNPSAVQNLCNYFSIPNSEICSSLMSQLSNTRYPVQECSAHLRKIQSSQWAAGSIAKGVAYMQDKKNKDALQCALQCFNNALKIDPDNIEALNARGAVYANIKCLRKAIEDFEKVLSLDPLDSHAKRYLSDTRLVVGKILAQKGDVDGSLENFTKSVELNEENEESLALMKAILIIKNSEGKSSPATSKGKASTANSILDTRDKLKHLIEEEQKIKQKKRRHSSVSSLSSSSASNQEIGSSSCDSRKGKYYSKQKDDNHKLMCEQFLESNRKRLAESQSSSKERKRFKRHSSKEDLKYEKRRRIEEVYKHKSDRHSRSESLKRKDAHEKPEVGDYEWVRTKMNEKSSHENAESKKEIKKRFERSMSAGHFSHHPGIITPDKEEKIFADKSIVHTSKRDPSFSEQSKQKVFFVLRNDQESKTINKGLLRDNNVAHCFRDDSDEEELVEVQPEFSRKPTLFKKPTLFLPRKYRSNNSCGGLDGDEEDTRIPKLHETAVKKKLMAEQQHYHYEPPRHYLNENPKKSHFDHRSESKNEFRMHENLSSKQKFSSSFSSREFMAPKINDYTHSSSSSESYLKNAELGIQDASSTASKLNVEPLNNKLKMNTSEAASPLLASTSSVASRRLSAVDVFKHDLMKF